MWRRQRRRKRHFTLNSEWVTFCNTYIFFHASLQAISLTIVILNILIARDIHVVASIALSQFNDRTISKVRVESLGQLFKILHFCFDFSFISLGFSLKQSYKHWHSCMLLAATNVCLNLPSEIFEYLFVNSFNYNSIRMVVSRWVYIFRLIKWLKKIKALNSMQEGILRRFHWN